MPDQFSYKIDRLTFENLFPGGEDVFIDITPLAWLPFTVQERFTSMGDRSEGDVATPEDIAQMGELLTEVIVAWNIKDREGGDVDVHDENAWKQLPPAMIAMVMDKATEDQGEIPLASDKSSSDNSPAASPPNRAVRRAEEKAKATATSQAGQSKRK